MALTCSAVPERNALRRRAIRLEYLTITWNSVEAIVALTAGGCAASIALIGFGLDSIIEMVSGATLLWRFKQQSLAEHHAESRAVKVVGFTFFALAAYVSYEAITDLWFRRAPEFSLPGLILAALSLAIMPVLAIAKRRVARALNSRALAADSMETLLCSYMSATLLAGLALNGLFGWRWADPVAGLAIAGFMVHEGVEAWWGDVEGETAS
jgi:divalent metal cation (Fe/Co/Zn/Cd) transporter